MLMVGLPDVLVLAKLLHIEVVFVNAWHHILVAGFVRRWHLTIVVLRALRL